MAALAFCALTIYQAWKIFNGSDEPIWDTLALVLFLILSITSFYAVAISERR